MHVCFKEPHSLHGVQVANIPHVFFPLDHRIGMSCKVRIKNETRLFKVILECLREINLVGTFSICSLWI